MRPRRTMTSTNSLNMEQEPMVLPMVTAAGHGVDGDDSLILDCLEFDGLERLAQAICSSGASIEEDLACGREVERLIAQQAPILQRIVMTRAHTGRGILAKAASLALWEKQAFEAETTSWNVLLMRSLVQDILGVVPSEPRAG